MLSLHWAYKMKSKAESKVLTTKHYALTLRLKS